jgi:uncharacterized damage-inducible protein DinB
MTGVTMTERPAPNEFAEFYGRYIDQVADGPVLETLARQLEATMKLLSGIAEARGDHRYAPGKWSIKDVVGHVTDVERVFACRALQFARGEKQPLPGMEQDDYVTEAGFAARKLADIAAELEALRRSNLAMFAGFSKEQWMRRGTASGFEFSVRSIPWILAGHELHHVGVLRERYF